MSRKQFQFILRLIRGSFALVGIYETLGGAWIAVFLLLWLVAFTEVEFHDK